MSWQGYLRKASTAYDITVCGRSDHAILYSDFCKGYIPCDLNILDSDCHSGRCIDPNYQRLEEALDSFNLPRFKSNGLIPQLNQTFVRYGGECSKRLRSVVVHARNRQKRAEASYSSECWDALVAMILNMDINVYAIGTEAYVPTGASNYVCVPLETTIDMMSRTSLVIGPSSGPMHLASLCGTPHVVWTDNKYYSAIRATNRERYERIWNPLGTECEVIDDQGWQPDPQYIFDRILPRLEKIQELT